MGLGGLRTTAGAEASAPCFVGRRESGAGELQEITAAQAQSMLNIAGLAGASFPIAIAGDYSDDTVVQGIVAALVASGLFTDATTA